MDFGLALSVVGSVLGLGLIFSGAVIKIKGSEMKPPCRENFTGIFDRIGRTETSLAESRAASSETKVHLERRLSGIETKIDTFDAKLDRLIERRFGDRN